MTTILKGGAWRLSFLTSRLVRLEYQPDGLFEDGLTTCARCRDFPPVALTTRRTARGLEIDTEHLHLVYDENPFSRSGLSIAVKGGVTIFHSIWRYGDALHTLGGTARTLDEADGEIPVEEGLVSLNGFSVLDDSASMLLTEDGRFLPRENPETDLYFFGYGHDYAACLQDFHRLSGPVPMPPRYALGNWWSRYHEYTQESYLRLMDRFEAEGIPLAVAVIDMDWHLTHVPYGSGWTGYTWNRELFPDPPAFLEELHRRGMRVTLNLHPADGVQPHEEAYPAMCRALGRDPGDKLAIDFDAADEDFLRAYMECLHHPLEEEGVDFWWIDWQQGSTSGMAGLDPLWVLNERHYRDNCRKGERGMILSRYAGPGSHRCPIGFSGDSIISWASLDFQPRFTAMAANIGYPWWSHDIGGHMRGIRSDELSLRWLQFGVFSPILRLHSSKNDFTSKEPWSFEPETGRLMTELLRLRHRLIPYLYTAARRASDLCEAPVRPVYHRWPEKREAYTVPNQYLFGPELMVCPITTPIDPALRLAKVTAWLPEGLWYDFLGGQAYTGNRMLTLWRPLSEYPVLAPAGSVVPLAEDLRADELPAHMTLRVFAGANGSFELYEDDGVSLNSDCVRTEIALDWQAGALTFSTRGEVSLLPQRRVWQVECVGFAPCGVSVNGAEVPNAYDEEKGVLRFTVETEAGQDCRAAFTRTALAQDNWLPRVHERLHRMQTDNGEKEAVWRLLAQGDRGPGVLTTLRVMCKTPGLADCLEEILLARDEGGDAL